MVVSCRYMCRYKLGICVGIEGPYVEISCGYMCSYCVGMCGGIV